MTSSTEAANVTAGNPWIRNHSVAAAASPFLVFVVSAVSAAAPPAIIGDHSWPPLTASERQNSFSAAPPGGGEGSQPMTMTVPSAPTIPDPAINPNPNPNNRRGGGRNHHHHNNNNHQNNRSYVIRGPGLYYSLSDSMHHIPFHPNGMSPPSPPPPPPVHYWPQPPPQPQPPLLGWDVYCATTNVVHRSPPPFLQNGHHRPVFIDPSLHYHQPVPSQHHMLAGMITTPPLLVLPPPSVQAKLMGDIRKQIEYYFSEENLTKDLYLKQHMDNCGWVDLDVIGKFNRVKALTQDIELVRRSLMVSDVIELEGFKIRRRNNWRRWILG